MTSHPPSPTLTDFEPSRLYAHALDEADPLREHRAAFAIPHRDREELVYLCGNSLGLMPHLARTIIDEHLDDWATRGVDGHLEGARPWYRYHERFRGPGARLVGAHEGEVVMMNTLTVNLHLMLVSFFRPEGARCCILTDWPAFPSDLYALKTHLASRGLDPETCLIVQRPRPGEAALRTEDIERTLTEDGDRIALVCMAGVNFFTGQVLDLRRITAAAHAAGAHAGFDLAHGAGNVPLSLHDWNVDFACWCSYKYLNAGPGAIAGCYVHARHTQDASLPRYGGWWGNDPDTRFQMHQEEQFIPRPDADGWQLSNPPILSLAPLEASLALFDRVGMPTLRAKSEKLTGYLRRLLETADPTWFDIITPPDAQGCQLSILIKDQPRARYEALQRAGVVADFREPNVVRLAPVPLYNTYEDVWRCAEALGKIG